MKKILIGLLLLGTGCVTQGGGMGSLEQRDAPPEPIAFLYTQRGAARGQLRAIAKDGELYLGQFEQGRQTVEAQRSVPPAAAWYNEMAGRPNPATTREFVTVYTGTATARLRGDRGHELRCRLELDDASFGLRGGAVGRCERNDGEIVAVIFPSRS